MAQTRRFDARRRRFFRQVSCFAGALGGSMRGFAVDVSPRVTKTHGGLARRIDALYAALDKSRTPGGVVAVIHRGEILHLKGYGAASREFEVPWTPDTRYRVASITKSFTATAVLILEERGLLRLTDPVRKYLPDFPDFAPPPTLHNLVTMTSGLWQDETLLGLAALRGTVTLDEMYGLVKRQRKLNYAPGSATTYIDTNFRLLARVIAAVMRKSFWDAMQDLVYRPLGMQSSLVAPDINRYYENQALTYLSDEGETVPNILAVHFQASGDGSMIATMRDMVRWLQHLRQDHRNPKSLFARMTEPFRLADGTTAYYRRGISVREHRGLVGWGHGGFTGTDYIFWPEIDLVVANFSNSLGGVSKSDRSLQITDAFLEEQPDLLAGSAGQQGPIDPKPLPLSPDDAALLAGTFVELENGYILESRSTPATATVAGGDSFRYQFLGSETRVVKRSEKRYETPSSYWPLRLSIEPASCGGCARPDFLVRHADWPAARRFVRVKPGEPADVRVEDYLGHYGSDQLGICYSVVRAGKALDLLVAAGVAATQILHMTPLAPDIFRVRSDDREFKDLFAVGTISVKFRRGAGGRVRGMRLSLDRVRDLDFTRVY